MKQHILVHIRFTHTTPMVIINNCYFVNIFSLICLMDAISRSKEALIIQIIVHSHTNEVARGASK